MATHIGSSAVNTLTLFVRIVQCSEVRIQMLLPLRLPEEIWRRRVQETVLWLSVKNKNHPINTNDNGCQKIPSASGITRMVEIVFKQFFFL